MGEVNDDTTIATLDGQSIALGENTLVTMDAEVSVSDGTYVDTASAGATTTATGDDLAATDIISSTYHEDGDGSGVGVETTATGVAIDGASSTSGTQTSVISTGSTDVLVGTAYSAASGGTYQDANSSADLYVSDPDSANLTSFSSTGSELDIGNFSFSSSGATGIVVDSDFESDISIESDVDIQIDSDVDVDGNLSQLSLDAEAIGTDTLVEVDSSVLTVEDQLSSVTLSVVSAVE